MADELDEMLADGSMELAGWSEDGEALYRVNSSCKYLHPQVYREQYSKFLTDVDTLWQAGYIDLQFENDDVQILLNDKSTAPGDDLTPEMKHVLSEIVIICGDS